METEELTPEQQGWVNAQRSWATLQPLLMTLDSMPALEWMIRYELATKNRLRIIERIYARWNRLRQEVDRRNLAKGILPF